MKFSILVPEPTTNYITNPCARYDTTGWNAAGSTLTRVLTQARFGVASLRVVTAGSAIREGAFFRVSSLSGVNEPITVSAYVRGEGKVRIRVIANPTGTERSSQGVFLRADRWTRISVTGRSNGSNDLRLYVELDEAAAKARTFYVAGAQLERKSFLTTYCDGDQPGCRWTGTYHGSLSTRSAYTRAGGRWAQLAGEEREAEDLYVTVVGGLGMASITNHTQPFAFAPGSYFQNVKVNSRITTFTFYAKHSSFFGRPEPVTLQALHQLRSFLIDAVKPDKTTGDEDILFEYQDGDKPIYFRARYDGGLEGEWDIRNQWINSFPLRLLAASPLLYEDSQEAATLDFQERFTTQQVVGRVEGEWSYMNGGLSSNVNELRFSPRGELYAIGSFSQVNLSAGAPGPVVSPNATARGIAYFDGEKWNALNTVVLGGSGSIESVDIAANGYVYVGGTFTSIGGVAANRIAYWNGSSWNAMGAGMNNDVVIVRVAPNGDVYAGGNFTTAGGVSCFRIARWDGLQWRRVGQFGGLDGIVRDIVFNADGSIVFVCGDFGDQQGVAGTSLSGVAQYNTSTGLFSALVTGGLGTGRIVQTIFYSKSGILYIGGAFASSGITGGTRLVQWNGNAFSALSTGVDNDVVSISGFTDGSILIVGIFQTAGGIPAPGVVIWNGSKFINVDLTLTSAAFGVVNQDTNEPYIATTDQAPYFSDATLVENPGTAEVKPLIYVLGPGKLRWIENVTTGRRMNFNLDVQNQEEVFIDCARGQIYSKSRPSLFWSLVPGSDFASFSLLPGENKIVSFMTNDVGAKIQMYFTPQHWSVDATENEESL